MKFSPLTREDSMDDTPAWMTTPGEVERQHAMRDNDLMLTVVEDALAQAKYDHSWAATEPYPSATIPKSVVVSVARRRVQMLERLRQTCRNACTTGTGETS